MAEASSIVEQQMIEDIYPLSSIQQGMLFHTLLAPESGAYTQQVRCVIDKSLELSAFTRAAT